MACDSFLCGKTLTWLVDVFSLPLVQRLEVESLNSKIQCFQNNLFIYKYIHYPWLFFKNESNNEKIDPIGAPRLLLQKTSVSLIEVVFWKTNCKALGRSFNTTFSKVLSMPISLAPRSPVRPPLPFHSAGGGATFEADSEMSWGVVIQKSIEPTQNVSNREIRWRIVGNTGNDDLTALRHNPSWHGIATLPKCHIT